MSKTKFKALIIIGIFNFIFCTTAMATSYYVSNSGSDKASGTSESSAWKTIAKLNLIVEMSGQMKKPWESP